MKIKTLRTLAKIRKKRHAILSAVTVVILFTVYQNCGTKAASSLVAGSSVSGTATSSTIGSTANGLAIIYPQGYTFTASTGTNQTFIVTNASAQTLMNLTTTIDTSAGGFVLISDACNGLSRLASGGSCIISVGYSNTTNASALTGSISVKYRDSTNALQTALYASLNGPGNGSTSTTTTTGTGAVSYTTLATAPVYRFYQPKTGEHFFTLSTYEGINNGFSYEEIAFHVFTTQGAGTVPLYRCYVTTVRSNLQGKHFTSLDPNCEGYTNESTYGYIFSATQTGLSPLGRYYNPRSGDHLTTLSASEAAAASYSADGIEGYTVP
jgi:hypothetical protein